MVWSLHELTHHPVWLELTHHPAWLECMREEVAAQLPGGQCLHLKDMHICTPHRPPHACMLTDHPAPQCFPVHLTIFHETLRLWLGVPKNVHLVLHNNMLPTLSYPAIPMHKGNYLLWNDWSMMCNPAISPHSCPAPPPPR